MTARYTPISRDDWTWLLRVPVADGHAIPMELWFMYHAGTLLPMQAKGQPDSSSLPAATATPEAT